MDMLSSTQSLKFNMKCKDHRDHKVSFLNVSDVKCTQGKVLLCNECLSSNGSLAGRLVTIKSAINAKENTVINNWPFFQDEMIQNLFNHRKHDIHQKIITQFDKFKTQVAKLVDNLQKKVLASIEQNECDKVIEEMISRSQLNELSEILMSDQTYEDTEANLKKFLLQCSQKFSGFEQDLLGRKKSLCNYDYLTERINKEQEEILKKIKQQICHVQEIDCAQLECLKRKLQFIVTDFQNCESFGKIEEECDHICIKAMKNKVGYPQMVSDLILDKQQKYILRVEIQTDNNYYYPMIGLIRQSHKSKNQIYQENLSFYVNSKGIKKVIKGSSLYEVKPKEIEMFISISDNKLIVADYPHHQNIMTLLDTNCNLKTFEDLSLGFSIGSHDYEATYYIKEFYTVGSCPNW